MQDAARPRSPTRDVAKVIKKAANIAGQDPSRYSTDSLRIGGTTALFAAGIDSFTVRPMVFVCRREVPTHQRSSHNNNGKSHGRIESQHLLSLTLSSRAISSSLPGRRQYQCNKLRAPKLSEKSFCTKLLDCLCRLHL